MLEVQLEGGSGGSGTPQRVADVQKVMDRVKEVQQYAFLRHTMHKKVMICIYLCYLYLFSLSILLLLLLFIFVHFSLTEPSSSPYTVPGG